VLALYKGLSLNLLRVLPSCSMTFISYEFLTSESVRQSFGLANDDDDVT
jgi:hypothetical protein